MDIRHASLALLAVASGLGAGAAVAEEPATPLAAILAGKPILDVRARVEGVDQTGKRDAEAYTARTRVGWTTGTWRGWSGLIEIEDVSAFGPTDYNDGLNGRTAYAGVSDPEVTELNRLQVSFAPWKGLSATVGRQKLILDDQRFVGEAAFRQDTVTFDAVRLDGKRGGLTATYAYVAKANRGMAEAADWDSDAHLVNVAMKWSDALTTTGFGYFIDVQEPGAPRLRSSQTLGARAAAGTTAGPLKLAYTATLAEQRDYGNNPNDYELGFAGMSAAVTYGVATAKIGIETQEGDGTNLFATPFGAAHGVQGWSDAFSLGGAKSTVDGLEDFFGGVELTPAWRVGPFSGLRLEALHRDFTAERTGRDLGSEWNALLSAKLGDRWTLSAKWADYDGPDVAPAPADRAKAWAIAEFKL